jgi:hypothetical protein
MILSFSASLASPVIKSLFAKTLYHGSVSEAHLLQTLSLLKNTFARGSENMDITARVRQVFDQNIKSFGGRMT